MVVGGLLKSTSRLALVAAAGILVGGITLSPAKAADLGGDCCADLEERVAELEATTVRKGNRKVSLTLSGQVNRALLYWNDGHNADVYQVDNALSSTRFRMTGSAKIHASLTVGFSIEMDIGIGSRSLQVNQLDSNGSSAGLAGINGGGDYALRMRLAQWWMQHAQLGKLTVGRLSSASDGTAGLDLGDIVGTATAHDHQDGGGAGMFLRLKGVGGEQGLLNVTLQRFWGFDEDIGGRWNGIRYDSPTIAGFTLSAAWGQDDRYDVGLRYAGEFSGLRLVAAVGYGWDRSEELSGDASVISTVNSDTGTQDKTELQASMSAWHVPTGIFLNVSYRQISFDGTMQVAGGQHQNFLFGTQVNRPDVKTLWIAAGIKKNFFGVGFTSLYGEYGKMEDGSTGISRGGLAATVAANGGSAIYLSDTSGTMWGLGIVQQIDAAAMELYLAYRHYSFDATGCTTAASTAVQAACAAPAKVALEDLDVILAGARIKF